MLDGRILNDRYKIKKMIGGGGMANVYLARDIILDRDVAIKVLRLEYANDEEFIARFHREAQSATSLSHPNIVNIYDVGEEDSIYYMVMEYVDGMTLKKYIQMYGPVEVEESIDIMKQITSAISHAHENEIVHRDIKPQNILIDPFGQVKVTDFGIAVALSATSLTQTNSVLGSVHYLSPEQARGGMANKKSDIYSLGIVLFELLTGRLPFSGQTAVSIALKHLQSNTPSIRRWNPDLPQSIENIVLKATTKDPFNRYDTVYEMEEDLETALSPDRLNEAVFLPPEENGEATKAIPIITDDTIKAHKSTEDTLVHTNTGLNSHAQKNNMKNKGEKKRPKALIWIFISLFILIGSGLAALFILPNWLQPDDVDIPNVVGMEYEEAFSSLKNLGLDVEREMMYSEEVPEGYVVRTNPEAGMTVKEGQTITVFSSQGKEKVAFKNYVGQDYDQVERLLKQAGYKDVIHYPQYSDRPKGEIITQIQPQPDEKVVPEDTIVNFGVSQGPEKVTLGRLVGMTEQEAYDYVDSKKLSIDVIGEEPSDEIEEGRVIRQNPEANTLVEEKSVVEIVLSTGPREKPPINHSVTIDVPYTGEQQSTTDGEMKREEQQVRIYVGDMENEITNLYEQHTITEDAQFTIQLVIPPDSAAEYRVIRDEQGLLQEWIRYEDVEDE